MSRSAPSSCALVARDIAFGLQDLRLDRTAVQRDQEIALFHARAIGEMHCGDFAVDPALDRDTRHRHHGAERLDPHRGRFLDGGRDLDRNGAARRALRRLRDRALRREQAAGFHFHVAAAAPATASTSTTANVLRFVTRSRPGSKHPRPPLVLPVPPDASARKVRLRSLPRCGQVTHLFQACISPYRAIYRAQVRRYWAW